MLSILTATVIGMIMLSQRPTVQDLAGIALITTGGAIHQEPHGEEAR